MTHAPARAVLLRTAAAAALAVLVLALLGSCDKPGPTEVVNRTLTVELSGYGKGSVTSQPAGIDCSAAGGTCTATLPQGTRVTLTGTADARSEFGGWSEGCSGTGACAVTLNGDVAVGAAFENPRLVAQVIGPAGGTMRSLDERLTLTVPAGALDAPLAITIEAIDASVLEPEFEGIEIDAAYDLGPPGLTFEVPIELVLLSSQELRVAGDTMRWKPELLYITGNRGTEVLEDLVTEVHLDRRITTRGRTKHFSRLRSGVPGLLEFFVDVPDAMLVGENHTVSPTVLFINGGNRATFWDLNDGASVPPTSMPPRGTLELQSTDRLTYSGTVVYTCKAIGTPTWDSFFSAWTPDREKPYEARLFKPVECRHPSELIIRVEGPGSVISPLVREALPDPARISCGPDQTCTYKAVPGATFRLSAEPLGEDSEFVGWSGATPDARGPMSAEVTITPPRTEVVARFRSKPRFSLELTPSSVEGRYAQGAPGPQKVGELTVATTSANANFAASATGNVTVKPARGSVGDGQPAVLEVSYDHGSGTVPGIVTEQVRVAQVTDDGEVLDSVSATVRIVIEPPPLFTLSVAPDPRDKGGIISLLPTEGPRIDCPEGCGGRYPVGTEVVLAAFSVDPEWEFDGWSGVCTPIPPDDEDFDDLVELFDQLDVEHAVGEPHFAAVEMEDDEQCIAHFRRLPVPRTKLVVGDFLELDGNADALGAPPPSQSESLRDRFPVIDRLGKHYEFRAFRSFTAASLGRLADEEPRGPTLELVRSVTDFCPGAVDVFFHRAANSQARVFTALSPDLQRGCRSALGSTANTTISFQRPITSGVMAGTNSHLVYSDFRGIAHVRHIDEDLLGRHDRALVPEKRSCPWSSASRSSVVLIVAREGAAGTSNEECTETRGLYRLEIQGFNTSTVTGSLRIGTMPREVVLSPDGTKAYLVDFAESLIHVIDVAAMTVLRTIPTGSGPTSIARTADGALLLVTNWNRDRIQVIDEATGEVLLEAPSRGRQPVRIRLAPDDETVVVLNYGDDQANAVVSVYSLRRPTEP